MEATFKGLVALNHNTHGSVAKVPLATIRGSQHGQLRMLPNNFVARENPFNATSPKHGNALEGGVEGR